MSKIHLRGCGLPQPGCIYIVTDSYDGKLAGRPVESFLVDPVMPIPMGDENGRGGFGLSCQGMEIRERNVGAGIYDVWDWIGEGNYPNVLDWYLEVKELGFHQLIERSSAFELLSKESLYLAVHPKAHIYNISDHAQHVVETHGKCPKNIPEHKDLTIEWIQTIMQTCPSFWYSAMLKASKKEGIHGTRNMPSFSWDGYIAPEGMTFAPGLFFRLPIGKISNFVVYEDKEENRHISALQALERLDAMLHNKIRFTELK
jgi:hypothetical protein